MLATYWYPSTDLIGSGSIWPAVGIAAYAFVGWRMRWRWIFVAAPVAFLAVAATSEACPFPPRRRFPDVDNYLGYYLLLAATGVSAMELARRGTLFSLLFALPFLFVAGLALAIDLAGHSLYLLESWWQPVLSWNLLHRVVIISGATIWLPLFVITSWRITVPYRRAKRARAGCCLECGYDLRASPQRCPECGSGVAVDLPQQ